MKDDRDPMARIAFQAVPSSIESTPCSTVPRRDGTAGPQKQIEIKRPAGPDCQHISERLVQEVVQEKRRQIFIV